MSKLFNTILIQIALLCCNFCYSSEEPLTLSNFTRKNLMKYDQIDSSNGTIYRLDYNGNKIYPTYEGYKCYDFQTKVKSIKQHCETLSNMGNGGNLVVKTLTNTLNSTYVVSNANNITNTLGERFLSISIPSNTNVIIPEDIIVNQNDVTFYTVGDNVNLFILGILNNNIEYEYENAFFYFGTQNCNVFVGPKATVTFNNINHDSLFCIGDTSLSSSIVPYPGCSIYTNSILKNTNNEFNTINSQCTLYLNRYLEKDDILHYDHYQNECHLISLNGVISPTIKIIYPTNMAQNSNIQDNYKLENINNNGISYVKTSYFPGLYWKNSSMEHTFSNDNVAGSYCIENPFPTIQFNEKQVLTLNPANKFANYDIQLLDDCLVENGKYSFREFVNIPSNTNKYIDVDTIEDLFMNGKTYSVNCKYRKGLLNNMPSDIYTGLIGNKDIVINYNNNSICTIYGSIIDYHGKLLCAPGISKIVFKHPTYTNIISKQKFKYTFVNDGILEYKQEQFGKDIENIIINDKQYSSTSNKIEFFDIFCDDENEPFIDYRDDVSKINDYNLTNITWNLYDYKNKQGDLINKLEECFRDGNIYKPSNRNNVGLINNIPIDILNYEIKANLSGNKPISIFSNNERSHITFSGNNTQYTGNVSLSPNINSVYFQGDKSILKINVILNKGTLVNNNILQSITSYGNNKIDFYYNNGVDTTLIDESTETSIKLNDIITTVNDNRDSIKNINKYNISGVTWNIDTIENCFKDGKGLLDNFPSTIKANIVGNKDIVINSNTTVVYLLGNNSKYTGKITIPEDVTEVYKSKNFNTDNIVYKGKSIVYTELSKIEEVNDNIIELDITNKEWKNDKLVLKDVNDENPYKIIIKGDNKCFDEITINITNNQEINLSEKSGIREIEIDKMKLSYDTNGNK